MPRLPMAPEGWPFVFLFGLLFAVARRWGRALSWFFLFLLGFSLYFFRDPEREIPEGDDLILAPADGKIVDISHCYEPHFLKCEAVKISIFLNITDVHINRSPVAGAVEFLRYLPGKFLAAFDPKASTQNEQNLVGILSAHGPLLVKQIAGLVARRIVCRVDSGCKLAAGQRFGLIRFGSRTDLFIPKAQPLALKIKIGDRVEGGSSILAERCSA